MPSRDGALAGAQTIKGARLLAFGLPGLPLAALGVPLFIFLPGFYAQDRGINLTAIGIALLVTRLWDAVSDPLIGQLSDRLPTRIGRRKPWMLAGIPVTALSLFMLFLPPEGAGIAHLFGWSLLLYLGWTMIQIPYAAWGAELSGDYHQRSRITAYRESLAVAGTLVASAMPAVLGALGYANGLAETLEAMTVFLLLALPLAILLAIYAMAEPPLPNTAARRPPLRAQIALLLANRPFLRLIVAYLLNGAANGLAATLFVLFVEKGLGLPDQVDILLLTYFLCGIAGVPIWLAFSRRFGKHRAWIIAMSLNCAIFAMVPLLSPGDFGPFLAICIFTGLCLGADLVLPPSMQADVIDVDTASGGGSRAGIYFALWGMATKLALALAVGIAFPALDSAGFSASGENSDWALLVLALLYGGLPVLLKLTAIAVMNGFPITAEMQAELRRRIEETSLQNRPGDDP